MSQPISADQLVAVQTALSRLNERMRSALAKGDAAAQKAAETLKNRRGTPGRPIAP